MDKGLRRGSSRHLAHVGSGHGRVQVLRLVPHKHWKEVPAEALIGGANAADRVRQPGLHLQEVREKLVDAESV